MAKVLTALFGGTFDPIHYGHLLPAIALAKEIKLAHISLLPNHIPPHKPQPEATTSQRLAMLRLAIENYPIFSIDMREITKAKLDKPSYTIDTLKAWRNENGNSQGLAFILGQDSLLNLPTWHNWQTLLDYCHLLICRRPGYADNTNDPFLKKWIKRHQTNDIALLHQNSNGSIYFANTPLEDISATEIRQQISSKKSCETLLPAKVWQYIQIHHLYGA
ncbi:nicotinate-nucleotide adenylyltransferase [Orbus sturtevantii]|uniref:nicotinate-nucleotide adenylyltransferase n=1 Tax=Orbus sturtevantii TaxID=3074109 RepID=UPI00370D5DD0